MVVVCKPPSLWCFCYSSLNEQRQWIKTRTLTLPTVLLSEQGLGGQLTSVPLSAMWGSVTAKSWCHLQVQAGRGPWSISVSLGPPRAASVQPDFFPVESWLLTVVPEEMHPGESRTPFANQS